MRRLNSRSPRIAMVNSSADMRRMIRLSTPLAAMLYWAESTLGLAISVASTLRKFWARAMEKLPLPQ